MAPKNNREQKQVKSTSTAQGNHISDVEEYAPIYFHNENEDYGFMSNFHMTTFMAPHPATWLSKEPETIGNAHCEDQRTKTMTFRHSEQYYMYCKAIYFGDENAARDIMGTDSATKCKSAGRSVKGFSEKAWQRHDLKVRVMEEALWWKFGGGQLERCLKEDNGNKTNNKGLRTREGRLLALESLGKQLLGTGERELVEAAGQDRYWGIGYRLKDGPHLWREKWGRNQLGKSLMVVRERLRELVGGDEENTQEG
jgi:ribA/ribD-fused uncharacterized protein